MLPYENATSGSGALDEIRKVLTRFGCQRFGTMTDNGTGELIVQFNYKNREVVVKGSYRGYAAAWLKEHPHTHRMRRTVAEHERLALDQAQVSICSVLRDYIKGQVTAIATGIKSFEGAFLDSILLPSGRTVLQEIEERGLLKLEPPPAKSTLGQAKHEKVVPLK